MKKFEIYNLHGCGFIDIKHEYMIVGMVSNFYCGILVAALYSEKMNGLFKAKSLSTGIQVWQMVQCRRKIVPPRRGKNKATITNKDEAPYACLLTDVTMQFHDLGYNEQLT